MEWWRELFTTPLWQDVQLSWEQADDADADTSLVVDALELRPRARVLDVPCGTGRIAKRLRARGHEAFGLDATDRFLVEAATAGVPVVRADMRTSPVRSRSFDAACCLWGSFGYFDDEGNRSQTRALADALRPAGRCLVDTIVADTLLPRFEPHGTWELAGIRVDEDRVYDATSKRIETTWSFTRGAERATQVTSVRLYTIDELVGVFGDAGFVSFQVRDAELLPFGPSSERLWLVAAMPG
jgi:SAM-dependent methyltransferase